MHKTTENFLSSWFPILSTVPIGTIAVITLISQVPAFFNPCMQWGLSNPVSISVSTAGPCLNAGGTSETVAQGVLLLALIQGGILSAIGIGALGILRSRPLFTLVGSVIMFLESGPLVLDGFFVFTILAGISLLWSSRKQLTHSPRSSTNLAKL